MQNKESLRLRECPFCGGDARIIPHQFYSDEKKAWVTDCYGIDCQDCHASSYQFYGTERQAIEAWNRRVGDTDG